MRTSSVACLALVLVVTACDGAEQPAPTSAPPATAAEVTVPATSTTSEPATTSTSTTTTVLATTTSLAPLESLAYESVATANFPMIMIPDESGGRELVGLRTGEVIDLATGDVLLDLAVPTDGERGLLGMAVDTSGRLFVHATSPNGATNVLRFEASGNGFDPDSRTLLLEVPQPASNHNGGMLQFGPDGRLYLGLGDGGGANDRFGHGQDFDTLLGGLVAIDPESGAPELVAGGLRNPFRFWIDSVTSTIAIGDVGQNLLEEVSVAPLDGTFHNFGWPITEGFDCFGASSCDRTGLTDPIIDIAHGDAGTCSIAGGVVYRGAAIPELDGQFLFSDFCGGYLRSVDIEPPHTVTDWTGQVGVPGQVVSFGTDRAGEVYVLTVTEILKVVPQR